MPQLSDFIGPWLLDRDIHHDDGSHARLVGTATWVPENGGAWMTERGTLTLPGQGTFSAERRYFWDGGLQVFFDDGRFFHAVPPQGGGTGHWCPPDQYDVAYDFSLWPDWQATWRVMGPRKGYRMISRYRRAAA